MKIDSPNALGINTGFGVPTGGTINQILSKVNSDNYNTQWVDNATNIVSFQSSDLVQKAVVVTLEPDGWVLPIYRNGLNQPIIGITQTSGFTNDYISVAVEGGLSTVHSGLTPSYNYYVSPNGTISLTGETYIGVALSETTILVSFGSPNGVVTPSLSIIDNSIANPNNITVPGRYIVPVSGLTGSFVGNQNDYADYNGVDFTFVLPTNNDKAVITTGPNAGNVYLFTSGSTSGWTLSSQSTTLPTSNWSSGVAYKQFDLVIYQSVLYQANGNIPANTAFNVGTSGATFKQIGVSGVAENGQVSNTTAISTTSVADVVTFTLPTAGTYQVYYGGQIKENAPSAEDAGNLRLTTTGNVDIPNTQINFFISPEANITSTQSNTILLTVTGATSYKLRVTRTSGNIEIDARMAKVVYNKIAGFLPVISSILDNSASGYIDVGNVRYQWGTLTEVSNSARTVTFPAPFLNTSYSFTANVNSPDFTTFSVNLGTKATTNIVTRVSSGGSSASSALFNWMAIGLKP